MWAWTIQKLMRSYGGMGMGRQSWSRPSFEAANEKEQAAFAEKMGPILAEFEQSRQDTFQQVDANAKIWAPLGLAGGIIAAVATTYVMKNPGIELPLACIFGGVAGGMYMATSGPVRRYEESFKTKVMPHLLARFGDFKLLASPKVSVEPLIKANILPGGTAAIEDEISGQYRGRDISMAELEITSEVSGESTTWFDGLVLKFELPRDVSGRTVIYPKEWDAREKSQRKSFFGKVLPEHDGLDPVALESVDFANRFTVRSTDQIGARVLLSPAFMERLTCFKVGVPARATQTKRGASFSMMMLAQASMSKVDTRAMMANYINSKIAKTNSESHRFSGESDVVAIAEHGTLLIAIPKMESVDYFEPPPYWIETNADAVLMHLSIDIQNMLDIADAVFDLDYRTRTDDKSGRVLKAA